MASKKDREEAVEAAQRKKTHVVSLRIPGEDFQAVLREAHRRSLTAGSVVTPSAVYQEFIAVGAKKVREKERA